MFTSKNKKKRKKERKNGSGDGTGELEKRETNKKQIVDPSKIHYDSYIN
jgi:hypothetical protein